MKKQSVLRGIVLTLFILVIHLVIINDYGLTWDFHFHFFGGAHLLGYSWQEIEPRNLPYSPPDPRHPDAVTLPYGALVTVPPVLSYIVLHRIANMLPFDAAYNLTIVFAGVIGIAILYLFLRQAVNDTAALIAVIFLSLLPRYFGDLHNNMKDVPMAAVFALNMWLLYRLVSNRRRIDIIYAVGGFILAFNTKINSIFIPIIFVAYSFMIRILFPKSRHVPVRTVLMYCVAAPILALAVFGFVWGDLLGQLKHMWLTFAVGANNIEVLFNGTVYFSAQNVPWYYPYEYLVITTPIPILVFFLFGLVHITRRLKQNSVYALLILWFFIPLTRYLTPRIAVIDGIRHFEEVLYPLAVIAAIGAERIFMFINNVAMKQWNNAWRILCMALIMTMILSSLMWNILSFHPFQITYFNELVGGVNGAYGKFDLDYWGSSQKKAIAWINEYAKKDAVVHIVMAADVASRYLRQDLLDQVNTKLFDTADYVVLLNRTSFLCRYGSTNYLLTHTPVHSVDVHGVPLVFIYDNALPPTVAQKPYWQGFDSSCIFP